MTIPDFSKRKLCMGCGTIDFHIDICAHCGGNELLTSEQLTDGWTVAHKNQRIIALLQEYLDEITAETEKFENQWFKDWNNEKAVSIQFEPPKSFPELWGLLED